jgi:hypothetical protein
MVGRELCFIIRLTNYDIVGIKLLLQTDSLQSYLESVTKKECIMYNIHKP